MQQAEKFSHPENEVLQLMRRIQYDEVKREKQIFPIPELFTDDDLDMEFEQINCAKRGGIDTNDGQQVQWLRKTIIARKLILSMANDSLVRGFHPRRSKTAILKPLLKPDGVSYRPISCLNVLDKVIQGMMARRIAEVVLPKIHKSQYGSQPHKGAEMALIEIVENL